jgi:hypothetical protein
MKSESAAYALVTSQIGFLRKENRKNIDVLREQNRMIRDLEKRVTKVEADSRILQGLALDDREMTPELRDSYLRGEEFKEKREISTQNVFVVTRTTGAIAVYEQFERALEVCQRFPGAKLAKRRLMRGK